MVYSCCDSGSDEDLPSLDSLIARAPPSRRHGLTTTKPNSRAAVTASCSTPVSYEGSKHTSQSLVRPDTTRSVLGSVSNRPTARPGASAPRPASHRPVAPQGRTPASATETPRAGAGKVATSPEGLARHAALADELFPPSPPAVVANEAVAGPPFHASTSRNHLTSLPLGQDYPLQSTPPIASLEVKDSDRESYCVSDSEVERAESPTPSTPSPLKPAKVATGEKIRARVSHATTSLDSDDQLERRARLSLASLSIDDDTPARTVATAATATTATPLTKPPSSACPASSSTSARTPRAAPTPRRRPAHKPSPKHYITLSSSSSSSSASTAGSDSETESDAVVGRDNLPVGQDFAPGRRPAMQDKQQVADRYAENGDVVLGRAPTASTAEGSAADDAGGTPRGPPGGWGGWGMDDEDWDSGVLTFEPTPRKLSTIAGRTDTTPARARDVRTASKPSYGTTRRPTAVLTLTDSEDDTLPPMSSLTPARPQTTSPVTPAIPTTPATRPKATRKKAPTPAPSNAGTEAILTPAQRTALPLQLIAELDRSVFRRAWRGLTPLDSSSAPGPGLPTGIEVRWSKTLRNTAGRATWRKVRQGDAVSHVCHVDLAVKVTDTASKLRHTLAHELCHIAAWCISGEVKPSHGGAFKMWGARVMQVRPDISVTTTHAYEIVYKYRWRCKECSVIFGRHSRSIDADKVGCGCGGRLAEVDQDGHILGPRIEKKKTGWQEFMAATMPQVRARNPGISQPDVMREVSELWAKAKQASSAGADALSQEMARLEV